MKIDDIVELESSQIPDTLLHVSFEGVYLIHIGIGFQKRCKCRLGKKMNFSVFHLIFQMTQNGCGQDDISNGAKPDNEVFNHLYQVLEKENQCQPVF